jgi:hypothetical protein
MACLKTVVALRIAGFTLRDVSLMQISGRKFMRLCICGSREGAGAKGSTFSKNCLPPKCWQLHSPVDVSITHVLRGKHRDLIDRPKIGHQLQIALCNNTGLCHSSCSSRFNVQSSNLQLHINWLRLLDLSELLEHLI